MANQKLAVVYITHRVFTEDEIGLFRFSLPNLAAYDKFLVVPHQMNVQPEFDDFNLVEYDPYYFRNINGYNELLMTSDFYRHFIAYENILVLQPDCVVLKPGIDEFCDKSLFLGASFKSPKYINRIWLTKYPRIGHLLSRFRIGIKTYGFNGGFSVRNIPYFIEHAPALRTNSRRLLYREDIVYSYIYQQEHDHEIELSDRFCLEEKLASYQNLDQIDAYGMHDPQKYNCKIYGEILERSKSM